MCDESSCDCLPCKTVRFDVPAAGEPKPALKYRLFPPRFMRKVGNAAPLYRKAFEMAKPLEESDSDRYESMQLWTRNEASRKEWWGDNIPKELSPEEVLRFFADYEELYAILDEAALCAECDWELSTEDLSWWNSDSGFNNFIDHTRTFSWLLAIRASYALAQNDLDLTMRSIQIQYALADHLTKVPMGVHALTACALAGNASGCVAKLILSGKSPNLYWALTQLPRFSNCYLRTIESEKNDLFTWYPELREIDNPARDEDHGYWQTFGKKFLVDIQGHEDIETEAKIFEEIKAEMGGSEEESLPLEEAIEKLRQERLDSAEEDYKDDPEGLEEYKKTLYPADPQTILDELPTIKQTVLNWGYPPERVEQLCPEHIVAIYTVHVYEELWDEIAKWSGVDYVTCQRFWEGVGGEEIQKTIHAYDTKLAQMIANVFGFLVQPFIVGIDEEIDALRVLEAIRLYAASHDGKLPKKLDKITEVPVPLSPLTGGSFRYKTKKTKEGRVGVLEFTTNACQEHRYEIRIVRS